MTKLIISTICFIIVIFLAHVAGPLSVKKTINTEEQANHFFNVFIITTIIITFVSIKFMDIKILCNICYIFVFLVGKPTIENMRKEYKEAKSLEIKKQIIANNFSKCGYMLYIGFAIKILLLSQVYFNVILVAIVLASICFASIFIESKMLAC